jgi:chemosensory pili system protein ChpA (sensor histidine kinase/response regulator)
MQMAEQFDISTLAWVKGEIDDTLKQARLALEAYVEDPNDQSQLEFCISYVHQVFGTLQMVELLGAALFAEEVEKFAVALRDGQIENREQAFELLMRAILQLPDYLESLLAGKQDNPISLLPLLNEMRGLRGEQGLNKEHYFRPNLSVEAPAQEASDAAHVPLQRLAKKVHPYLLPALAKLIKDTDQSSSLKTIATVIEKLLAAASGTNCRRLLWVASAFIEGLRDGSLELSRETKPLLGKIEQQVRVLAASDEAGLDTEAVRALLNHILFQLAHSSAAGARAVAVKKAFQLEGFSAEDDAALGGMNADLKKTVSSDIMEELGRAKDIFDIYVRSDRRSAESLQPMVESLSNMADTLSLLQEDSLRAILKAQVAVLQQLLNGEIEAGENTLMGVAGAIITVESTLRDWGSVVPLEKADAADEQVADAETSPEAVAEHQRVTRQVMKEARDDLIKMREAVNSYLEKPEDKAALETIPALMHLVIGSLNLLSYKRVAQILTACRHFVERELIAGTSLPSAEKLDALADAVMSIEYYLEAFVQSRVHPGSVLEVAENAVALLGYSGAEPIAETIDELPDEEVAFDALSEEFANEVTPDEMADESFGGLNEEIMLEASTDDLEAELQQAKDEPELEDNISLQAVPEHGPEVVQQQQPVAIVASRPQGAATVEIDDEILEIFVEEAEEELQKIGELLPKWSSNPGDAESLKDLRRCFHTLKGSGRLVGATEVGEFAWAFENILNRVIDGTLTANATIHDMLEQAHQVIPELMEHFKGGAAPSDDAEMLRQMAEEIVQPGGVKVATPVPVAVKPATDDIAKAEKPKHEVPDLDPVLLEIYSKETQGHLEVITEYLQQFEEGGSRKVGEPMLRALHTLKGSSNMAGITSVSDVSASLERYCKTLQALHEKVNDKGIQALHLCVDYINDVLAYLFDNSLPYPDNSEARQLAEEVYAEVQHLEHVADARPEGGLAGVAEAEEIDFEVTSEHLVAGALEELPDELQLSDIELTDGELEAEEFAGGLEYEGELEFDGGLESDELLAMALDAVSVSEEISLEPEPFEIELSEPDILLTESEELEELTMEAPTEELAMEMAIEELTVEAPVEELMIEAPAVEPSTPPAPVVAVFEEEYDQELLEIFIEEAVDILDASEQTLQEWVEHPDDRSLIEALQRQLHTLKGGARMAGITPIGDLSHSLESTFDAVVDGLLARSPQMMDLLQLSHDRLVTMLDQVRNQEPVVSGDDLIARVEALAHPQAAMDESVAAPAKSVPAVVVEEAIELLEPEWAVEDDETALELETVNVPTPSLETKPLAELDSLFEYFAETQVAWQRDVNDHELFAALRDAVDSLNRGCHVTAIAPLIEIADAVQVLVSAIVDGHVTASEKIGDLFTIAAERMHLIVSQQREQKPLDSGAFLISSIRELIAEGLAREEGISDHVVVDIVKAKSKTEPEGEEGEVRRKAPRIQQEVVRVRADLLDDLVNFAGEVSIYRSRVEQQIGTFGSNLGEMDQTITRLREQLRQVEIETEAQIDSRRAEAQKQGYEDFDPLEFDRFTNMQTLSRSMAESLNDLLSIESVLRGLSRETETLLLQQSRVNTELQESLMHTRMVPMAESAPRLRRVVRQTASELGKRAALSFEGAEVEMDRNVVERMMAPLEHMLRNSIAHGIEDKATRKKAGKPDEGSITIALTREGSEIVIRVSDDGGGINLEAVKNKAIDRGLMQPGAQLSNQEVMHFILESGFSTADALTQVAGRGVGMDVVNSEIRQLGGVLEIDSIYGKGTMMTARLPLTLSVSRALLVYVGDDIYAIPLPSISGIERISGAELESGLDSENPTYNWLGDDYSLMHLTGALGAGSGLVHLGTKQPLLLTNSGGHRVAFAVDGLIGSREIVVKSLGPQLSTLQYLAGATILADGSVALIIDMPALVRRGFAKLGSAAATEQVAVAPVVREPVVMVVDDSITVRKVTERLLKRNNMKCVTAKDGVDAITVLDEVTPDVMLLDIEMPRMDGFELATFLRNSERFKQLPIIMITSRTGDKHRQHAMDIGVNEYMGKPYTEVDLMANIEKLLQKA